jgi:hypothetical protein
MATRPGSMLSRSLMSDGKQVQVPASALERHAATVEDLSSTVYTAKDAGNQVRLGRGAYGQLCQWVPGLFDPRVQPPHS